MANSQHHGNGTPENTGHKEEFKDYSTFSLYNVSEMEKHLTGLALAAFTPTLDQELYRTQKQTPAENSTIDQPSLSVSQTMMCSVCNTAFSKRNEQILHYKLDWHRYNIKLKLQGKTPVPECEFDEVAGDISSLSGSDSSSDDEKSDCDTNGSDNSGNSHHRRPSVLPSRIKVQTRRRRLSSTTSTDTETEDSESVEKNGISQARLQPKLYFKNQIGKIIALYRCVVHGKENIPQNEHDLLTRVTCLPKQMVWAVILVGGGHFAAAVYNQSEIILHKTFHRYTVRAKQGSSQGTRDNKHGIQPKSAGASLRRHNEASLLKDIQDLLGVWNSELQKCSCIFYRAPSFNRVILFGGKNPPFKKGDCRLRNIPFPTRRATFNEVQRVFKLLSTLECFGERPDTDKTIPQSPKIHLGMKKAKKYVNVSSPEKVIGTCEKLNCDNTTPQSSDTCVGTENIKELTKSPLPENVSEKDNSSKLYKIKKNRPNKPISRMKQEVPITLKENKHIPENYGTCTSDSDDSVKFELVDEHIETSFLKELEGTYRKKPHKKRGKQRNSSVSKRQQDPSAGVLSDEKCNMKNALFIACRSGDLETLKKLLNILKSDSHSGNVDPTTAIASTDKKNGNCDMKLNKNKTGTEMMPLAQQLDASDSGQCEQNKGDVPENNEVETFVSCNDTYIEQSKQLERKPSDKKIDLTLHIVSDRTVSNKENANSRTHQKSNKNSEKEDDLTLKILNDAISDSGATVLHVATKGGHQQAVRMLLECGADPTARDKQGLTPYMTSNSREMRNEYRHFMAENPDRFDYNEAQIPSPLNEEMQKEKMERRKEKKKIKKEKLKEKKAVELEKKIEEEEKKRFLSLSDREKRALAAEKRFVKQLSTKGESAPVLSRCFQCGENTTGKVPFEYNNNCFCSIKCVKDHRKSHVT